MGRSHLGLLEKKKDYLLRSKDYHSKQKRLKALKEKASLKNPDEFYFGMVKSQLKNGIHFLQEGDGGNLAREMKPFLSLFYVKESLSKPLPA